jgi:hypothetical protein
LCVVGPVHQRLRGEQGHGGKLFELPISSAERSLKQSQQEARVCCWDCFWCKLFNRYVFVVIIFIWCYLLLHVCYQFFFNITVISHNSSIILSVTMASAHVFTCCSKSCNFHYWTCQLSYFIMHLYCVNKAFVCLEVLNNEHLIDCLLFKTLHNILSLRYLISLNVASKVCAHCLMLLQISNNYIGIFTLYDIASLHWAL